MATASTSRETAWPTLLDLEQRTTALAPFAICAAAASLCLATLICYGSSAPRPVIGGPLIALAGTTGATAQVWPRATRLIGAGALTSSVCGTRG